MSNTQRSSKKTQFDMTFDQTVTITESFYPSPSFTRLFAELGGSLGLWLGVGAVQLFSLLLQFITYLKSQFRNKGSRADAIISVHPPKNS